MGTKEYLAGSMWVPEGLDSCGEKKLKNDSFLNLSSLISTKHSKLLFLYSINSKIGYSVGIKCYIGYWKNVKRVTDENSVSLKIERHGNGELIMKNYLYSREIFYCLQRRDSIG